MFGWGSVRARLGCSCVVAIVLCALVVPARADAGPERARATPARASDDPPASISRRPVPDYDGRPDSARSPVASAVWVPRVLLFPAYLVFERFVRFPLGRVARWAEENDVPRRVVRFFRFGPEQRLTLAPIWTYELGFRPSIGALFRARGLGSARHHLTTTASFGGRRWYAGRVIDTFSPPGSRWRLRMESLALSRPDRLYAGLGPAIEPDKKARYHEVAAHAAVSARRRLRRQSSLALGTGYRYRRFNNDVGDRISIADSIASGALDALPPGFAEGYSLWFVEVQLALDTRKRALPSTKSGYRLEGRATTAFDLRDGPTAQSFALYGGAMTGFIDLSGAGHMLKLMTSAVFSDAFSGQVPFTELPALSGAGPLGGFSRGYLTGDSGVALSVTYTWPVSLYIDGRLSFALGNVFDGHLAGFAPDRLRMSPSAGFTLSVPGIQVAEVSLGLGTDEFGDRPNVESVRVFVGSSHAF